MATPAHAGVIIAALGVLATRAWGVQAVPPPLVRPVLSAGGSVMEFDRGDDQAYRGVALRAGIGVSEVADIGFIAQHWPRLQGLRGYALQIEAAFFPAGRPRVAPYLVTGIGVFRASAITGSGRTPFSGMATTVGLGVHGRVIREWGVRVEGLVRFDAESFDDELRLWLTYAPKPRAAAPRWGRGHVTPELSWMIPVSGPWRFVEPAYGLSVERPVGARDALRLGVSLAHLRFRSANGEDRWDTRAVVLEPTWQRCLDAAGRLSVGGGPIITLMLEGPDDGARGGLQGRVRVALRRARPRVEALAGASWIVRPPRPDDAPGTDQRGVTLGIAISF